MKKAGILILILMVIAGCVKKTDWPVSGQNPDLIVVDGIITDQAGPQSIRITYPVTQLNAPPLPFSGADVLISNEDSAWQLAESSVNPGDYLTDPSFFVRPGRTYTLLIHHENKIYSAKSSVVPGSVFDELEYIKNTGDDQYHIDYVGSAFSSQDPAMWEILIDRSGAPGYENADSASCHSRMLFYTLPTIDVSEIFAPVMEQVSFPAGTVINERRYSLTPEHAEFLREMMLETNWTGGMFGQANANVTTNLTSGAIGYFGACSVTSLSLTVTP